MNAYILTMFLDSALNYGFQFFLFFLNFCCLINILRYIEAGAGAGVGAGAGAETEGGADKDLYEV